MKMRMNKPRNLSHRKNHIKKSKILIHIKSKLLQIDQNP